MQLTKRRLTDLWVVGRLLDVDDGDGDPIQIWLQKLNQIELNDTTRRCDAQRARMLAVRGNQDSDEWQALENAVVDYARANGPEQVVEFLLIEDRPKVQRNHESRIANEEKWSKDNYVMGLRDAWQDGLDKRWLENNDDLEPARVKAELDKFLAEVNEAVENEMDALRDGYKSMHQEEIDAKMAERLLEMEANQEWMKELWKCQLFYSIREPDNHARYFDKLDEVNALSIKAFEFLRDAYQNLEVDVLEGKDSGAPTPSSPSSEPLNGAATEGDSGLVVANP